MSEPVDVSRLTYSMGRALYRLAMLTGTPDSEQRALWDRMTSPQPGDVVIEVTSFRGYDPDGVGRLLRVEDQDDDPRHVVEPLHAPGTEQGWRNAEFIALPEVDLREWAPADR